MKININLKIHYLILAAAISATIFTALFFKRASNVPLPPVNAQGRVLGEITEKTRGPEVPKPLIRKLAGPIEFSGISSKAFLVFEYNDKTELLKKNSHEKLPIASLTKLMTALLAYEKLDMESDLEILPEDRVGINPSLGLLAGDKVRISDLLESSLICSANDSAKALARATAVKTDHDFVEEMNRRAKDLGMLETSFSNPLGFDSIYNFSTASDLAKLVNYTQNMAVFKNLGRKTGASFNSLKGKSYSCKATNRLIGKNSEIEAIKTGLTPDAKGAMIAKVTRAGKTVVSIVLESENREGDLLMLSDLAFKTFDW